MSNYVFGNDQSNSGEPQYMYALRRTDDGELYFVRVNQLSRTDSVQINNPGTSDGNYEDFQSGTDFFEGRDVDHNLVFENLNYEQIRWDDKSLYYYIDADGQLTVRVDTKYQYPSGI